MRAAARLVLVALVAAVAGCGDDDGGARPTATPTTVPTTVPTATSTAAATATAPATPTATAVPSSTASASPTATPDVSGEARYAERGPYEVGVTTLSLGDRDVEVWYPVEPGAVAGTTQASYRAFEVLPAPVVAILPPDLNIEVPMDAYRDVPASADGPFPILTFSHGSGGFRHVYSALLAGIASHGFVTASIDHLEWGLLAQVGLLPPGVNRGAGELVLATVSALSAASADPASPLAGAADVTRLATAGHSAGGAAAFALPERPEVKAMLGFATGGSGRAVSSGKPVLLVVGEEDAGTGALETTYEILPPQKRFVSVLRAAHNSFTDQCAIIHGGNNFIQKLIDSGFPVPPQLLSLALDGCRPENLAPAEFWRIVQHFTVAHLRDAFGLDAPPVGLGDAVADAFAPVELRYRHDADGLPAPDPAVLGFVVSGFGAVAATHDGSPCPDGFNRNPTEHSPPLADDCNDPTAAHDPLFQQVDAPGIVAGVDLDATDSRAAAGGPCAHDDFGGADGSAGVDLQYWRAIGCVRGFQPGEIADIVVDQAVRDGSMTILVELWGVDDPRNDDDVWVQVFGSTNPPPLGADGRVLPHGTLSVHEDVRYHGGIGRGRIVDGVLEAGPMDARVRLNIQIVAGDLTFHDAHLRLTLAADGTASGALYGFQPVEELYDIYGRKAGVAGALALGYTCSGLYAALTSRADGDYDAASGRCTSLSVGYRFDAVSAFVAR